MCMSCVTTVDALFVNGVIAGSFGLSAIERLRDRLAGRSVDDRRRAAYVSNASFVESLGLDATVVLGPPAAPASTEEAADVATAARHRAAGRLVDGRSRSEPRRSSRLAIS
jgi:hypothetical protein